MNMKMVYETPKMKAEIFRTDAYCAACGNQPYFTGWLSVQWNNVTNWFFGDNKIEMINQNDYNNPDTRNQYYYKQVERIKNEDGTYSAKEMTGNILYLEYSAPYNEFVLYQEAAGSGYYSDYQNGRGDNRSDPNDYDTFVSGANSLQVNNGDKGTTPWFEKDPGMVNNWFGYPSTEYYEMNADGTPKVYNPEATDPREKYKVVGADAWFADRCLGVTKFTREEGFAMIPS